MSIQSKSFGDALRAARRKAFLTQHDLAELIGAPHVNSISRWERNAVVPSLFYQRKLNAVFGNALEQFPAECNTQE